MDVQLLKCCFPMPEVLIPPADFSTGSGIRINLRGLIATVVCIALLLACSPPAAAEPDERQAVVDAMQSWERAVEANDFEALENHYMEDAVYYPHNAAPLVGREAIIERNRQRGTAAAVDITQKVDDVRVHHDWAIYSCLAQIRTGDSETVRHVRVLLVMQKDEDGRWKILRDIDNGTPEPFQL